MITDAVPRAAPDELTTRVGLDVVQSIVHHAEHGEIPCITVRLRRVVIDPEDSDGVPTAVEPEMSRALGSAVTTNGVFLLTAAEKVTVLLELYEQSWRDGEGAEHLINSPILVPGRRDGDEPEIRLLVNNWWGFNRWYDAHAMDSFASVIRRLAPYRLRAGALAFLRILHTEVFPTTQPYGHIPFVLLNL